MGDSKNSPIAYKNENDIVALDDDEIDDGIDEKSAKEESSVTGTEEIEDVGEIHSETSKAEDKKVAELTGTAKEEKNLKTTDRSQNGKISTRGALSSKKIAIAAIIVLIVSGVSIYALLSLIGKRLNLPVSMTNIWQSLKRPKGSEMICFKKKKKFTS